MKKIDKIFLTVVLLIAITVLICWKMDWTQVAQVYKVYVHMSPASAFIFMLSSSALLLFSIKKKTRLVNFFMHFLAYLMIFLSVLFFSDLFFHNDEFELMFLHNILQLGNTHNVVMSQITEISFLLPSTALVFLNKSNHTFFKNSIGVIASLLFFSSVIFLIGYTENVPVFYGSDVIPISLLSTISFFLLSIVLLSFIEYQFWPFSLLFKSTVQSKLIRVFVPIIIAFVLIDNYTEAHLLSGNDGSLTSSLILITLLLVIVIIIKFVSKNIGKDIENAESNLKQSERRFQLAARATNEVIWERDLKTNKMWRSDNFKTIFGWENDEFEKSVQDVKKRFHPDDLERVPKNMSDFISGKNEKWDDEYRFLKKDGTYAWVYDRAFILKNKKGIPIRVIGSMADITERKKAELKIIESEERFKLAAKATNEVIWERNLKTSKMWRSDNFKTIFGWENDEFSKSDEDIEKRIHPDDVERFAQKIFDFISGKNENWEDEYRLLKKDGTYAWVYNRAYLLKNEKGIPIRMIGSMTDQTARKETEIELLKLSTAVNQSPVSILITDVSGKIEYVNPKVTEITGYHSNELIGENSSIFGSGEKPAIEYQQLWDNITTGKEWQGEFHNKKKNGELFWEYATISPIIDSKGVITEFLAVKEDITAKKRAAQVQNIILNISNASQTEMDLEELMEVIQKELGSVVDTKNFFVAFYNEVSDSFHIPYYKDLGGDDVVDFLASESISGLVIKIGKSLLLDESEMNILELEKTGVGPNSKSWLGVPLKIKGKITGVFVVQSYEDVKAYSENDKEILEIISQQISISIERKRYEDQLLEALENAKENDRLKSAFLANMNHEIRTPMNAVLGFSDLLMKKGTTEANQDKYLKIINASSNRMMNIISDIVDVSKIDVNELILDPAVFNLNKLIEQLYHQFSISPKNNNTSITDFKGLKDDDSFIKCDETRLAQVLSNLLENALKFTHNGTVEFGYTLDENKLHFYVKDSGVGINAKDHQHIFERFGQSDNEISKVKEGTGLGLAICKSIVELFGGEIWVESEPSKGAAFYFTIPNCIASHKEKSNDEKPSDNAVINTTKNILIAEDEETNFWFVEAALGGHPFNLIHVENGKEAVETMQTNKSIDLILMDFNMPVMNGIDATIEIRKTNTTIPIIALTAYAMMADKEKALAIGCTDYLSKPVSKALLLDTINKYIHTIGRN
jgi:PAS domain S-box-containing protein